MRYGLGGMRGADGGKRQPVWDARMGGKVPVGPKGIDTVPALARGGPVMLDSQKGASEYVLTPDMVQALGGAKALDALRAKVHDFGRNQRRRQAEGVSGYADGGALSELERRNRERARQSFAEEVQRKGAPKQRSDYVKAYQANLARSTAEATQGRDQPLQSFQKRNLEMGARSFADNVLRQGGPQKRATYLEAYGAGDGAEGYQPDPGPSGMPDGPLDDVTARPSPVTPLSLVGSQNQPSFDQLLQGLGGSPSLADGGRLPISGYADGGMMELWRPPARPTPAAPPDFYADARGNVGRSMAGVRGEGQKAQVRAQAGVDAEHRAEVRRGAAATKGESVRSAAEREADMRRSAKAGQAKQETGKAAPKSSKAAASAGRKAASVLGKAAKFAGPLGAVYSALDPTELGADAWQEGVPFAGADSPRNQQALSVYNALLAGGMEPDSPRNQQALSAYNALLAGGMEPTAAADQAWSAVAQARAQRYPAQGGGGYAPGDLADDNYAPSPRYAKGGAPQYDYEPKSVAEQVGIARAGGQGAVARGGALDALRTGKVGDFQRYEAMPERGPARVAYLDSGGSSIGWDAPNYGQDVPVGQYQAEARRANRLFGGVSASGLDAEAIGLANKNMREGRRGLGSFSHMGQDTRSGGDYFGGVDVSQMSPEQYAQYKVSAMQADNAAQRELMLKRQASPYGGYGRQQQAMAAAQLQGIGAARAEQMAELSQFQRDLQREQHKGEVQKGVEREKAQVSAQRAAPQEERAYLKQVMDGVDKGLEANQDLAKAMSGEGGAEKRGVLESLAGRLHAVLGGAANPSMIAGALQQAIPLLPTRAEAQAQAREEMDTGWFTSPPEEDVMAAAEAIYQRAWEQVYQRVLGNLSGTPTTVGIGGAR